MIFNNRSNKITFIFFLVIALICLVGYSLILGGYEISIPKVYSILLYKLTSIATIPFDRADEVIIWDIRTPRILIAIFVGAALSISGVVYQSIFRNPIVEPYILGVSSGAAFGASLGILFPMIFFTVQVSAFLFAITALGISYMFARSRGDTQPISLILSGIIIGSIFSAMVAILKYISDDTQLREIVFWMMGGLYYATWQDIYIVSIVVTSASIIIWLLSWKLNILSTSDEDAKTLGVNPELYKFIFIILATVMTSVSVATVGIIAWVGLMIPHFVRLIIGVDNRYLIPAAGVLGAIYILLCDTLARGVIESEIPIGIITSIIGAPFLLLLLRLKAGKIYS